MTITATRSNQVSDHHLDATELFGGKEQIAERIVEIIRKNADGHELLTPDMDSLSPSQALSRITKSRLLRFFFVNELTISDAFGSPNWNGTENQWRDSMVATASDNVIAIDGSEAPAALALHLYVQRSALNQLCMPPTPLSDEKRRQIENARARWLELAGPKKSSYGG